MTSVKYRATQKTFIGAILLASFYSAQAAPFHQDGVYVGMGLGSHQNAYDWTTDSYQNPIGQPMALVGDNDAGLKDSALLTDLFVGYNWSVAPQVVVGVEAHIGLANNGDKRQKIPGIYEDQSPGMTGYSYIKTDTDWHGDLRGRVGYLVRPSVLVFATAGVAFTELNTSVVCPADTNVCNPALGTVGDSSSDDLTGWLAGFGVETALTDNLTARAEYIFTDYGRADATGIPVMLFQSFGVTGDVDLSSDAVTIGLAYTF